MDKIFISAEELLRDSYELAVRILESGYRPSYIVGVWRGGTPVGIAVQEVLEFFGVDADHFAIRTAAYGTGKTPSKTVQVFGLGHLVETVDAEDELLIVDDVFDSGRSVDAIIRELRARCRRNMPEGVKVATVWYKPSKNKTDRTPDFYLHETEAWLVFPHELHGLSQDEILRHKSLPERAFSLNLDRKSA